MRHHEPIVDVFYRPEVAAPDARGNFSKSPTKPRRFVEWLLRSPLAAATRLREDFAPLGRDDFLLAHDAVYVDGFFAGRAPHAISNGLAFSPVFAESVRHTNGSLVAALRAACGRPGRIALSPTSGFHHAVPRSGAAFRTFSGQVIASVSLYRERGLSGAWIDLDGHFGNSIEDSRGFVPDLGKAIPMNLNPSGFHGVCLADLERGLTEIGEAARGGVGLARVPRARDRSEGSVGRRAGSLPPCLRDGEGSPRWYRASRSPRLRPHALRGLRRQHDDCRTEGEGRRLVREVRLHCPRLARRLDLREFAVGLGGNSSVGGEGTGLGLRPTGAPASGGVAWRRLRSARSVDRFAAPCRPRMLPRRSFRQRAPTIEPQQPCD